MYVYHISNLYTCTCIFIISILSDFSAEYSNKIYCGKKNISVAFYKRSYTYITVFTLFLSYEGVLWFLFYFLFFNTGKSLYKCITYYISFISIKNRLSITFEIYYTFVKYKHKIYQDQDLSRI